jgi:SpoIID/LytB domain protein
VNRSHSWTLPLSKTRLQSLFGKPEHTVRVEVVETSESGRVRRLQLVPETRATENPDAAESGATEKPIQSGRVFSGEEWRRALGLSNVKSLKFEVTESGTGVQLSGQGYGHGVGLCQFGANGMARQGYAFAEIVQHYYAGVSIAPAPTVEEARARLPQRRMASRKMPAASTVPSGGE